MHLRTENIEAFLRVVEMGSISGAARRMSLSKSVISKRLTELEVKASLAEDRKSFDVGCVQINYRWHGHAFPTLEDMFDPEWTATYAAQFLRTLYEERGSWSAAAGAYHSLTPELAQKYAARFDRILADLAPGAYELRGGRKMRRSARNHASAATAR